MSRAIAGLILSTLTLMGCIITKDPSREPPENTPPVVLEVPGFEMNRLVPILLNDDTPGPDGGVASASIEFRAIVRDPDVDQPLQAVVFQEYRADSETNLPLVDQMVPPTMSDTRSVEFSIDRSVLEPGCRVLELHVSERFVNFRNPVPVVEGDLGRGVWFLAVRQNREDELVDLSGCQR